MSRCWWLATVAVVLLLLGAAMSLSAIASRPGRLINQAAFERIKDGMTPEEVEAVIGLKPGDYTVFRHVRTVDVDNIALFPALPPPPAPRLFGGPTEEEFDELFGLGPAKQGHDWVSDAGVIRVIFRGDKIIHRGYADVAGAPRRNLLDVLGRIFVPGAR